MRDPPHTTIDFRWHPFTDGVNWYVQEWQDEELKMTFGPMPEDIVKPFIAESKERLKLTFELLLRNMRC